MIACSVNEVEGLLIKAARGGGAAPAQAAAFGRAGVRHLAAGRDIGDLHAALQALPAGAIPQTAALLHGAMAGPSARITLSETPLMRSWIEALPYQITITGDHAQVSFETPERRKMPARLAVDGNDLALCHALAKNTYVPETEQSRLVGAGAGLTDND